jgi:hypothetical protein
MNRFALWMIGCVVLTASLQAQTRHPAMLRPVTSQVRRAGVYHFGLGTWTRHVEPQSAALDVVYANTCVSGYFALQQTNEYFGDEGRIPGPNGPVICDTGSASKNSGCHCHYDISAFDIGYCTSVPTSVSFKVGFQGAYTACALPASTASFTLTSLPGAPASAQGCWVVTIDLGASQAFTLSADGPSCTWDASDMPTNHLFGWTIENLNAGGAGPLMAGSGGFAPPCSMVDGTRWDTLTCVGQGGFPDKWPNNVGEFGFGMDTQDRFRDDSSTGGPILGTSGPGCYFFGGSPFASFYMRLFADSGCSTCTSCNAMDVCVPGVGGVMPCPCGNPQSPGGSARGCDNSAGTGGALVTSSGSASLSGDSLHFASAFETADAMSILFQGQLPLGSGAPFGQGVSCVTNGLVRLYVHGAVAGTTRFPQDVEIPVHFESQVKGDMITAGATRLYAVYYHDAIVSGSCAASATYNITQTQSLAWSP